MTGPPKLLVPQSSATFGFRSEHIFSINRTHSELVKFKEDDEVCDRVCYRINKMVKCIEEETRMNLKPSGMDSF